MPSSMAKLRTKFPNWSFDTVTALQRAMLETHYKELLEKNDSPPDAATLAVRECGRVPCGNGRAP